MKQIDEINHPPHYTFGKLEVIEIIEAWGVGYHIGNVIKYVARCKHKDRFIDDLKKALWYLNRFVDRRCHVNINPPSCHILQDSPYDIACVLADWDLGKQLDGVMIQIFKGCYFSAIEKLQTEVERQTVVESEESILVLESNGLNKICGDCVYCRGICAIEEDGIASFYCNYVGEVTLNRPACKENFLQKMQ